MRACGVMFVGCFSCQASCMRNARALRHARKCVQRCMLPCTRGSMLHACWCRLERI